jgi:Xaa-Pro aminopeptidase
LLFKSTSNFRYLQGFENLAGGAQRNYQKIIIPFNEGIFCLINQTVLLKILLLQGFENLVGLLFKSTSNFRYLQGFENLAGCAQRNYQKIIIPFNEGIILFDKPTVLLQMLLLQGFENLAGGTQRNC